MIDILGLDSLFAEMITGLGLALLVGNLLAWRKHAKGERPAGVVGEFRRGRVTFLLVVGLLMTVWGVASILNANPVSGSADAGSADAGSPVSGNPDSGSQATASGPGPDWKSLW